MRELSPLHKERLSYKPKWAGALKSGIKDIKVSKGAPTSAVKDADDIQKLFAHMASPLLNSANQTALL